MTVLLLLSLALQSQSDSVQIAQLLDEARNTVNAINAIEKYERCIDMADRARLKYLKSTCKLEVAPLYISNSQSDKGLLTYFQLVNSLTEQRRFEELFTTYNALSTYYASRQMPKSAADYLKDALRLSDSVSLSADKPVLLYEIGKLELEALELDLALEYLNKADGIASQESRKNLLLKILRLKAKTYETLNRLDEAVRENERILELLEDSGDRVNYTNQLNNLGFIEQRRGNTSKALDYFLRTLEEREEMGLKDEEHIPLLMNVAITYQNSKESKAYLNRALQAAKKSKNIALQAEILDLLSVAYLNEDDFYNAQIYNQSGLELMDGSMPEVEMELNLTASVVYEKLLEYETALEYYKAYLEIKDSLDVAKRLSQEELAQQQLYLQRTEKQIQEVVDKGEIKDYQLQQLKLESENKDIQLKNQQLDAKQKLQAARLRESELEKERAEQELRTAEAEKKNQDLILKQQQLEKDKVEKQNLLLEKEAEVKDLELKRRESVNRNLIIIVSLTVLVMILALFAVSRIRKSNKVIKIEKSKSDNLLLNILPKSTAEELKTMGQSLPRRYESVTVLFTDFKGFTQITETMPPEKLVDSLGLFFEGFDNIMKKHGLEKIKTIGDAYMCAGGIPEPIQDAAIRTVKAANEMLALTEEINAQKRKAGMGTWGIRIGVHTGPVVAGVIGNHKFQYDIWGDTVNLAARMESSGEPGKINISETTYTEIKDEIPCTYRGEIAAKNKGNVKMYFVD